MISISTALQKNPRRFQKIIYTYYRDNKRTLPWRTNINPYRILVSEIMLQQTQVDRVTEKYRNFIATFPTFKALAQAPLPKVLHAWQGLGYNRRALALKKTAALVTKNHNGKLSKIPEELEKLPGIGPATARSIAAFAFNVPTVFIETNIRTVFIHFFFPKTKNVTDTDILPLVEQTLDTQNPARWYSALMDYGTMLKKKHGNASRRSAHYVRQAPFKGSNRQIRGMILKLLTEQSTISQTQLAHHIQRPESHIKKSLSQLKQEGFITTRGTTISIITNK